MDEEPRDVRLPLMVTRSEAAAIDAWRYANHVPSRAEAIRRLSIESRRIRQNQLAMAVPCREIERRPLDTHDRRRHQADQYENPEYVR